MTSFKVATLLLVSLLAAPAVQADNWKVNWSESTCYVTTSTSNVYDTLEACCHQYFAYSDDSYNGCVTGGGGTLVGTNKWYIDWSVDATPDPDGACSKDCAESTANPECGGFISPHTTKTTYTTVEQCCEAQFGYVKPTYCKALSERTAYTGTNQYYLDSSEQVCVKDCPTGTTGCGGVTKRKESTTYADIAACCAAELSWIDPVICQTQSNPDVDATNRWHVVGSLCKKDCSGTGSHCADASTFSTTYATVQDCCKVLGYLDKDYCATRSDPVTFTSGTTSKWYVDWQSRACVQDCSSSSPSCKALTANTRLHDTAKACCKEHLSSEGDTCETASVTGVAAGTVDPVGTGDWYANYSSNPGRCVQDCPTGGNCGGVASSGNGVTFYKTPKECCSNKFAWYQQDLCEVISLNAGGGHTNLYYADQGDGQCHKDCASGGEASCNGRPTDTSQRMFTTAKECCSNALGWIASSTCENKSNNAPDAPATGTNKWFVNWQTNMCDQDCADTGGGTGCRGVHDGSNVVMHNDVAACCNAHFSWINSKFCASRSMGSASSGLYYPNQGEAKCYRDCPSGQGDNCKGAPGDLGIPMYDTAAACCSGSIGWADATTCEGGNPADSATNEYWIDWSVNKCVKNCPSGSGDSACGGMAKNWNPLYSTVQSCCSQPAFNNIELSDCQKS